MVLFISCSHIWGFNNYIWGAKIVWSVYSLGYGPDILTFKSWWGQAIFSKTPRLARKPTVLLFSWYWGSFPGGKVTRCNVKHSPSSSAKVKNEWSCTTKGKGKVHPRTGHKGPEGEKMYSCTLPSTSALDGGRVVNATPRLLYPRGRPSTHCRSYISWCAQMKFYLYLYSHMCDWLILKKSLLLSFVFILIFLYLKHIKSIIKIA